MSTEPRRFFVDSYGCAKNQVDAEEIVERLERSGWNRVDEAADAELVVINSCGFVEDAKKESIDAVLAAKNRHPRARVMLAGCLAQRYAEELAAELPEADFVFGNADLSRVAEAAEAALETPDDTAGTKRRLLVPAPANPAFASDLARPHLFSFPGSAYVKVSEGCSNRCSYCAIPIIRGPHRSRPSGDVVAEVRALVSRDIREIVLIGQDLGSWGADLPDSGRPDLPGLLRSILRIPGDFRVRALYVHPDHFPLDLLALARDDGRFLPYFDVPFQHASARVLAAMNRRGNSSRYLELVSSIRDALPDAVIRSTFLAGFPGETDEDFAELRDFQDKARLDWLGAFRWSREDGTPAYSMKGRVPAKTARARVAAIMEAQLPITALALERFVGRVLPCLVEETVEGEELSLGRIYAQAPEVDGLTVLAGVHRPGTVVNARIVRVNGGVDLDAVPVG